MRVSARIKSWAHRNRKRLIYLAIFAGIYYGIICIDWFLDRFVLDHPMFTQGATKITRRHFQQPQESVFNWKNFNKFLDNVTRYKPGILAYKSFYVVLLGAYLVLCIWVFLDLTKGDNSS